MTRMPIDEFWAWLKANAWDCFVYDRKRVARRQWNLSNDASVVVVINENKTRVRVVAYTRFKDKPKSSRVLGSFYKSSILQPDHEGVPRGIGLVTYLKNAGLDPRKEQIDATVS